MPTFKGQINGATTEHTLSILYLRCPRVELPTMQDVTMYLSILYLRCACRCSTRSARGLSAFNSLFEMPLHVAEVCGVGDAALSILYLRCRNYPAVPPEAATVPLSILYLRCITLDNEFNVIGFDIETFNSLFEMRRFWLSSQAPAGGRPHFQFSI